MEVVQPILNDEDNFHRNLHKEELCILFFAHLDIPQLFPEHMMPLAQQQQHLESVA